jgi:hypothetical protein
LVGSLPQPQVRQPVLSGANRPTAPVNRFPVIRPDNRIEGVIVPPAAGHQEFASAVDLLRDHGVISNDVPDRRRQEFAMALVGAFVSDRKDTT